MLQSMRSQRVRHAWETELNCTGAGTRNTTKMIKWVEAVMWGARNQGRLSPQGTSFFVSASPVFNTVPGKEQVLRTCLLSWWQNATLLGASQRRKLFTLPQISASVHSENTWPFGEKKKSSQFIFHRAARVIFFKAVCVCMCVCTRARMPTHTMLHV